jgi:4-amino-4-deoxy-L-arabinose transferase-like glycosyltransferase
LTNGTGWPAAPRWHVVVLALATVLLYAFGLSWAPVHLHYDEIRFAEQARSIAATGRDVNGRFLPMYFQMEASVWFHPVGVYLPALAFKLWEVSSTALRTPMALVGVLDVVLIYFIALRMFRHHAQALVAGALLATAPAHFIHSRMAVDYLLPTPFVLGWCLLLLRALDRRSHVLMFAATSMLGAGCYSYIAAAALMPMFLVVTLAVLSVEGWALPAIALAVGGFAWPLVPGGWFVGSHPEMLASTLGRYGVAGNELDPVQRIRETLTPWFISDRANLYMTFFSPGYLFVTGGGGLFGSTRTAGVFLAWSLPLMLVGFRSALVRYSSSSVLLLAGVLLPALAATVVPEPFAIGRAITMVPFGILLAVKGIDDLRGWTPNPALAALLASYGYAAIALGAAYLLYRARHGEFTQGGLLVVVLGIVMLALAYGTRRTSRLWPVVAAVLLACALQFAWFARDYFGDYRVRSTFWFNGNLSGAVARIVAEIDRATAPREVLLDQDVNSIDWYWRFHLAEMGRSDLASLARVVTPEHMKTYPLAPGTLFLSPALDESLRALVEARGMRLVATVSDPGDTPPSNGEQASYFLFER